MATGSVVWSAPIEVKFSDGRPRFPTLEPRSAGLYRLTFTDGLKYIGKAKDLNCRLGNYRNPCAGVDVENILHLMLVDANARGDKVTVETFVTDNRHALERLEIEAAIKRREKILNKSSVGDGLGYPKYVNFKIKYYEKMLTAARDEQKRIAG